MTHPNAAAAYFRRLHAKLVDRPLSDRDDAWFASAALLCEDVLANAPISQVQERLTLLVRLAKGD